MNFDCLAYYGSIHIKFQITVTLLFRLIDRTVECRMPTDCKWQLFLRRIFHMPEDFHFRIDQAISEF